MTMKNLSYSTEISYLGEYDVCVIGGGPAGVAAAIECAREGKRTAIVEATGMLGGMATAALVGPFLTCSDGEGEERVERGICDEILERTIAIGGAISPDETDAPTATNASAQGMRPHESVDLTPKSGELPEDLYDL